jgi:CRISPR-associated endonuclease/helicase Cas3
LISHYSAGQSLAYDLAAQPDQQPKPASVSLELIKTPHLVPDDDFIQRLLDAVEQGAQVCLVCNLVATAQQLYQQLLARIEQLEVLTEEQLLLFHSRFVFADRQQKEQTVLDLFGAEPDPENARSRGHLLIATQVVEQSLDLDFDWLITQLCPVDLLFQRMGRLHRHRRSRPERFAEPVCTVLIPTEDDYELHELIYGNSRVLWRTQQCLQQAEQETEARVSFPAAYRDWIEAVYSEETWPDEPERVLKSYQQFSLDSESSRYAALVNIRRNPALDDNDVNVAALTRDGEMNLNLILCYINTQGERCLLNGDMIDKLDESDRLEAINLNSVTVPKNWGNHGRLPEADKEGFIWLLMQPTEEGHFVAQQGDYIYLYQASTGLNRMDNPKEKP